MGDEERGQAEPALQPPDLELQLLAQLAVERAEGLVEQQQPRAEDHGAGERHPLLLPARELPRQPPGQRAELDQRQRLRRPLAISGFGRRRISSGKATFCATVRCGNSA